jgi:hypothetical protein
LEKARINRTEGAEGTPLGVFVSAHSKGVAGAEPVSVDSNGLILLHFGAEGQNFGTILNNGVRF